MSYEERRNRLEWLEEAILKAGEVQVGKVESMIRKKWGFSDRVINEYIKTLAERPKLKIAYGCFKPK